MRYIDLLILFYFSQHPLNLSLSVKFLRTISCARLNIRLDIYFPSLKKRKFSKSSFRRSISFRVPEAGSFNLPKSIQLCFKVSSFISLFEFLHGLAFSLRVYIACVCVWKILRKLQRYLLLIKCECYHKLHYAATISLIIVRLKLSGESILLILFYFFTYIEGRRNRE